MMKNLLKGTLTEENLLKAWAGESQARNRYNFFASKAKSEGYEQIAAVFAVVADRSSDLPGFDVAAEGRTGADTDAAVKGDAVLHQYITHACRIHAAHGTAFKDQSCFCRSWIHVGSPLIGKCKELFAKLANSNEK